MIRPAGEEPIMLIIMKKDADEDSIEHVKEYLSRRNYDIHQSTGANRIIIGVIGETNALDNNELESMRGILQVIRIKEE